MKKILGLLILCFTLIVFTGCNSKDNYDTSSTSNTVIDDNASDATTEEKSEDEKAYESLKKMNEDNMSALQVLLKEDIDESELNNAIELCDKIIGSKVTSSDEDLGIAHKNIYIAAQNTRVLADTLVKYSGGENTYQKQSYIETSNEKINEASKHLENYNSK